MLGTDDERVNVEENLLETVPTEMGGLAGLQTMEGR